MEESRKRLSVAVGIATTGRPDVLACALDLIRAQTRSADEIIVCPARECDLPKIYTGITVVAAPDMGLCAQRNAILTRADSHDIILFIDDDFYLCSDYLQVIENRFFLEPDIVGITGLVVADGATTQGIPHEVALELLNTSSSEPAQAKQPEEDNIFALYGCNMAYRMSAIARARAMFDERLPLYAWLEDTDFSRQVASEGRLVYERRARGVHLATKSGRTSGYRFGYSQIVNPAYLLSKGTLTLKRALHQALRNVSKNIVHSVAPEPWVDRRGRLRGNLTALWHLLKGELDPERIRTL